MGRCGSFCTTPRCRTRCTRPVHLPPPKPAKRQAPWTRTCSQTQSLDVTLSSVDSCGEQDHYAALLFIDDTLFHFLLVNLFLCEIATDAGHTWDRTASTPGPNRVHRHLALCDCQARNRVYRSGLPGLKHH